MCFDDFIRVVKAIISTKSLSLFSTKKPLINKNYYLKLELQKLLINLTFEGGKLG